MEFAPGVIVAQKYRVEHQLGSGATGEVWEAENTSTGTRVALKKLRAASSHDATARFKREAVILGRIRSEYVARLLDFIVDDTFGYVLALELIEGEALFDSFKRRTLEVEEAIALGFDLLSGLADLHQARIVHRDLKPSNIMERAFPDGTRRAVILDFGVSRLLQDDSEIEDAVTDITRGAMQIGTVAFMAPEQLVNSSKVGPEADLYAVGTILYRAVAGKLPFAGLSQAALASVKRMDEAPRLSTGRTDERARRFEDLCARALQRKPKERYASAAEVLADLRAANAAPGVGGGAAILDFDSEAGMVTKPMLELSPVEQAELQRKAASAHAPPAATAQAEKAGTQGDAAPAPAAATEPAPAPRVAGPAKDASASISDSNMPTPAPVAAPAVAPAPSAASGWTSSKRLPLMAIGLVAATLIVGVFIGRASAPKGGETTTIVPPPQEALGVHAAASATADVASSAAAEDATSSAAVAGTSPPDVPAASAAPEGHAGGAGKASAEPKAPVADGKSAAPLRLPGPMPTAPMPRASAPPPAQPAASPAASPSATPSAAPSPPPAQTGAVSAPPPSAPSKPAPAPAKAASPGPDTYP